MPKTNLQQQITVHAFPSKVWKVLTRTDYVNQYFLKDNIHCDWTDGSSILAIAETDKPPLTIGKVLESVPGMFLKFSIREENTSANLITTYELIIAGDGVELKMKCEGFTATNQEFFIRVQQANLILQKIKWLSEYS
ncbi:MAG: SRPBCC domain-containing protein [Chitinophagales bacterium]